MNIKELFEKAENGTLNYEQFEAAAKAGNAKFTDLNEGQYVSKHKYEGDLKAKDAEITTLNTTIGTRDVDLEDLKKKLAEAGADADKLASLTNDFTALQSKYDADTKQYQERLNKQAYEFAVREFAGTKKFSSQAARRDFTQSMIAENLKFKDGKILGAEDFVKSYTESNADAFVVETPDPAPATPAAPLPQFVAPTPGGQPAPVDANAFAEAFHFTGVRPIPNN